MASLEDVKRFVRANADLPRDQMEARVAREFDLTAQEAGEVMRNIQDELNADNRNIDGDVADSGQVPAGVMAWRAAYTGLGSHGIAGHGAARLGQRADEEGWGRDEDGTPPR